MANRDWATPTAPDRRALEHIASLCLDRGDLADMIWLYVNGLQGPERAVSALAYTVKLNCWFLKEAAILALIDKYAGHISNLYR